MNRTIEIFKHHETDHAVLVGESPMRNDAGHVWLPKSLIEFETVDTTIKGVTVRVTAPEWILIDKGLDHLVED